MVRLKSYRKCLRHQAFYECMVRFCDTSEQVSDVIWEMKDGKGSQTHEFEHQLQVVGKARNSPSSSFTSASSSSTTKNSSDNNSSNDNDKGDGDDPAASRKALEQIILNQMYLCSKKKDWA